MSLFIDNYLFLSNVSLLENEYKIKIPVNPDDVLNNYRDFTLPPNFISLNDKSTNYKKTIRLNIKQALIPTINNNYILADNTRTLSNVIFDYNYINDIITVNNDLSNVLLKSPIQPIGYNPVITNHLGKILPFNKIDWIIDSSKEVVHFISEKKITLPIYVTYAEYIINNISNDDINIVKYSNSDLVKKWGKFTSQQTTAPIYQYPLINFNNSILQSSFIKNFYNTTTYFVIKIGIDPSGFLVKKSGFNIGFRNQNELLLYGHGYETVPHVLKNEKSYVITYVVPNNNGLATAYINGKNKKTGIMSFNDINDNWVISLDNCGIYEIVHYVDILHSKNSVKSIVNNLQLKWNI